MAANADQMAALVEQLRSIHAEIHRIEGELAVSPSANFAATASSVRNDADLAQPPQRLFRLEKIIAEISSNLVTSLPDQIDAATNKALAVLGPYLAIDRIQLFMFLDELRILRCSHEWIADDIPEAIHRLQTQKREDYPWIFDQLCSGELIVVPDTRDLPDEIASERDDLLHHRIRSTLAVPMRIAGRTVGVLWFDRLDEPLDWPEETIRGLNVVGEILAIGLDRMHAERALAESRQFVEGVTESSPNIIYVVDVDPQSGIAVSYVNRQITRDLGRSPDEMKALGQDVKQLIHPDDFPKVLQALEAATDVGDDQVIDVEFRMPHASGEYRSLLTRNCVFQRDFEGTVRQIIGTAQDITERLEAEEALRQHRDHLAHVARLGALGEMVAGVAHEISQPLYSIVNFAKANQNLLATLTGDENEEIRDWNQRILTSAARAGEIIHRLRDYGRRGGLERIERDPDKILREAIELVTLAALREDVAIELEGGHTEAAIRVDRVQIQQVLVNLLQNAVEAMQGGPSDARRIVVQSSCGAGCYEVSVIDQGPGLPAGDLQIFEAFVTTKANGLGMGLAICKTIIEDHGGRIWAASNVDRGVTFQFTLPIAEGPSTHDW